MKLVIAVINRDDSNAVSQALIKGGFSSTKLATTGGFLMAGNVTLMIGVEEARVDEVIEIIKSKSHSRKQFISPSVEAGHGHFPGTPVEVTVGGATIFVVDVERFEHA